MGESLLWSTTIFPRRNFHRPDFETYLTALGGRAVWQTGLALNLWWTALVHNIWILRHLDGPSRSCRWMTGRIERALGED